MTHLSPLTEAQLERSVHDRFLSAGWYPLKTDAATRVRGGKGGHIETGFPDGVFLLGLDCGLCLAVVIELKEPKKGKLSDDQVRVHKKLRAHHNIEPHIVRTTAEVDGLIRLGRTLRAQLDGRP